MLLRLIPIVGFLLLVESCRKDCVRVEVEKNCTGTYLKISKKVFLVCNYEILTDYSDGDVISASYKKVGSCLSDADYVICMMYFPFDGIIEVHSIH
ncbi:hypothetical protein JYT72_00755 [Crocinitomix catalasitica]|nr:hypothetical protein [Crocinitomix catalasitica]